MGQHARGRLGPAGRRELVRLTTAHEWKARWLAASPADRDSGVWALDRSSRPHRSPRRCLAEVEARVCEERERTRLGPSADRGRDRSAALDRPRPTAASGHDHTCPLDKPTSISAVVPE
jgi:leucine-zipper of insertion element IS481